MEVIRQWRNAQVQILRQSARLTREEQEAYFDQTLARDFSSFEPSSILFTFWNEGGIFGYGGLVHVNWAKRSAEVSFLIDTELTGEALFEATFLEFVEFLAGLGTNELGLNLLTAEVFDIMERERVLRLLEKTRFVIVNKLKNAHQKEGYVVDVLQLQRALK